ncbi:NAD-dependent epimerase/dehydratase family protein [Nodosilinea sp. P-1105]|uniref:NAD-dependent epimerase/dehydratase family protein n=1 Tax=Nodosilinea sp. P-1105 TaxID=2546229 RepID=UPI00146A8FA3|nr:NAD-dependent epimerase/dehydratase family protein [Nodosilinea sp. P-1105]NMF84350.1 NAD-dependent epimerase/dehydratase family protein [Nodosilinea sp. P-1105]
MVQAPSLTSLKTADDVVQADLTYICDHLFEEFATLSGKNLLITGGAGFLGYYLVQSVLHWNQVNPTAKPIHLTIYDNYIRGVPDWLTSLSDNPNLVLVKHDITNPIPDDIADFQFIIHAASIASPTFYRKYPIETMDANVNGLRFLLEYCLQQKAKGKPIEGFLFYSTSEIYGDPTPENIPTPETYRGNVSCTGPRACYDESKRYGETLCVNFALQHDLPIKTARPFNNYGPGLKITDRRVLPDFARDIFSDRDIVMLSDGSPTRTFCYIADAIVGYYKILVKGHTGEAYNIGVETPEISMANLAERVVDIARDLFDYSGKVVRQTSSDQDYLIDNPNRRCPIIDKARQHLGYNPSITVDEGLKRSMVWYSGNRQAEDA